MKIEMDWLNQVFPGYQLSSSPNPHLSLIAVRYAQFVGVLNIKAHDDLLETYSSWLATEIGLWEERGIAAAREAIAIGLRFMLKSHQ